MKVKIIAPVTCLLQRNYIKEGDVVEVVYKDKWKDKDKTERYCVLARGGTTYVDVKDCEIVEK